MKTDIQIAQETKMELIKNVAARLDIQEDDLEFYGKYKAKFSDELWEKIKDRPARAHQNLRSTPLPWRPGAAVLRTTDPAGRHIP